MLVTSRERFLLTSKAPTDPTEAAMNGLLLTPLLGCTASHSLDWCHAWALLGAWANFMVFPLPSKRRDNGRSMQWPRHGHTGKLKADMQKRTPSLVGWARPAFEQGALPPLSLLPANCPVCVLPGDKLFQSDTLNELFMNPVIFHGFSGNKGHDAYGGVSLRHGGVPSTVAAPRRQHFRGWHEMDCSTKARPYYPSST